MIFSYEKQWFGINFKTIQGVSVAQVANKNFYDEFYRLFFKKYQSYDDLPIAYLNEKKLVSTFILSNLNEKFDGVVSIGCGNGIVEHFLSQSTSKAIYAYEPSLSATKLIDAYKINLKNEYYTSSKLHGNFLYYASYIDYVMSDDEYLNFLKTINTNLENNGKLLMLGLSIYQHTFPRICLYEFQKLRHRVFSKGIQLWGYLRTESEHIELAKRAGFNNVNVKKHTSGFYYMELISD